MTNVGKDLFASYRKFKAKMVDSPSYSPLGQRIIVTSTSDAEKKEKLREYHREYYRKNREKIKKYQRDYWRKEHENGNHKGDMIGLQKKVYEYLLDQYRKGEDPARGTEIARALGISENSVYTAVFQLTKKGYLGRGTYGRYLLLKFPKNEQITVKDIENTIDVLKDKSKDDPKMVFIKEKDYDDLVKMNNELKKGNKDLQSKVDELRESNTALIQERENKISSLTSEIRGLRNELVKKIDEFNEFKDAVKVLLKYFQ